MDAKESLQKLKDFLSIEKLTEEQRQTIIQSVTDKLRRDADRGAEHRHERFDKPTFAKCMDCGKPAIVGEDRCYSCSCD